jgi:hypothetical protein
MDWKKLLPKIALGGAGFFVVIQLVPYGRNHENPKVTQWVRFPNDETKALMRRACLDCHSNETVWPWYSHVAPLSWLIYRDVTEGRRNINFSEWDKDQKGSEDTVEMLDRGKMPFLPYLFLHSEARLTDAETKTLKTGLQSIQDQPAEIEQVKLADPAKLGDDKDKEKK